MLWAIDVGNSQTVVGGWEGGWRHRWRFSTDSARTGDELATLLAGRASLESAAVRPGDAAVLGTVVPSAEPSWVVAFGSLGLAGLVVLRSGAEVGLEVLYDPPHALGADRVANALQALAEGVLPCIVVDVGTATTIDALDAAGRYVGGAIMPGPELAAASLASGTAKLGAVPLAPPAAAVGRTTAGAIQSGVLVGHAGAVDRLVAEFRKELGGAARTVATGGLAGQVAELCREEMELRPDWTLDGLRRAWERLSGPS